MLRTREISAFGDELMKISARRSVEVIRELMSRGDPESLEKAEQIAKTPGAVKTTAMGSQIKDLGMGNEGLATLVATPEGMRVRKLYDPKGISSPEMIARKAEVGSRVTDPSIAKFHGVRQTPVGGGTAHMMEYVPGAAPSRRGSAQAVEATQQRATRHLNSLGVSSPTDIRRGNMVVDARTGKPRVIDYLPTQADEAVDVRGRVGLTPKGTKLIDSSGGTVPKSMHAQQATHLKQRFMRPGGAITPEVKRTGAQGSPAASATRPGSGRGMRASRTVPTRALKPKVKAMPKKSPTSVLRPTVANKPKSMARKALSVAKRVL